MIDYPQWSPRGALARPLVFGDIEQIACLKDQAAEAERRETCCARCTGEGTIECPDCDGSGEKHKPRGGVENEQR